MSEEILVFFNQPWYLILFAIVGGAYFVYTNFKEGMDSVNKNEVSYRYSEKTTLTDGQLFAIALDAVMTAYWEVDNDTLAFTHKGKKPHHFDKYMSGWFIDTKEGYEDLTKYFFEDGRRSYFNFIYPLFKNVPQEQWSTRMAEKYGETERPYKILSRLNEKALVEILIQEGVIDTEADLAIGVMGWDISTLVGQARRAYTAGLVSETEALHTIERARQMALANFKSWKEFGRSQVLGMALDYYQHDDGFFNDYIETYKQVFIDTESPWNTTLWPS